MLTSNLQLETDKDRMAIGQPGPNPHSAIRNDQGTRPTNARVPRLYTEPRPTSACLCRALPPPLTCLLPVCGLHHLIFDEPGMRAALLPSRAQLLQAIEEEEADRAYRLALKPVQMYRTFPLAYEFDSDLPVRSASFLLRGWTS
jgi:hypothetical protein